MANFPVLSRNPIYPLDPDGSIEDVVIRSPQASGYEQTRPRSTRARRNFGLNYINLASLDEAALRTFEVTTLRNGADSFLWTHPTSAVVYTVRLTAPIKISRINVIGINATLQIREV